MTLYKQNRARKALFVSFTLLLTMILGVQNIFAADILVTVETSYGSTVSDAILRGFNFSMNRSGAIIGIVKNSGCTDTNCYIYRGNSSAANKEVLQNSTFVGVDCNFSSRITYQKDDKFIIVYDKLNTSRTVKYNGGYTYPRKFPPYFTIINQISATDVNAPWLGGTTYGDCLAYIYLDNMTYPNFVAPTPANNDHINTTGMINITCSTGNVTLWADYSNPPTTVRLNNLPSPANWTQTNLSSTTVYYKASCDKGVTNTSIYSFTYDATPPAITINPTNFHTSTNLTVYNVFDDTSSLQWYINLTLTDDVSLYQFEVNINYSDGGGSIYNNITTLAGVTTFNYLDGDINSGWFTAGESYYVDYWLSDTHTSKDISQYAVAYLEPYDEEGGIIIGKDKQNLNGWDRVSQIPKPIEQQTPTKEINFKTEYDHNIDLLASSGILKTTKLNDRYIFEAIFDSIYPETYTIDLTSDSNIEYLDNSIYQGHFIISNNGAKEGNWIDFQCSIPFDKINYIADNHYQIVWNNVYDDINCKSIGGLNIIHKRYFFTFPYIKIETHTLNTSDNVYPALTTSTLKAYINASTTLSNPVIGYNYYENNTLQGSGGLSIASDILYNYFTFVPPTQNGTAYIQATLSATCPTCQGGVAYTQTINSNSLDVYTSGIDNCSGLGIPSNATTLNVSFWNLQEQKVNVQLQATINYSGSHYSHTVASTNNTKYCIYPSSSNLSTNTQFLYIDSFGTQYSYFLNAFLSNQTTQLKLYMQNGTSAVTFSVTNLDNTPLALYKIQILQYNVGTGAYTTTEILQTDSNGHAIGNVVLNNMYYNIMVYDSNNVLVLTQNAVRFTGLTYSLTVSGISGLFFTNNGNALGIDYSMIFNNATNNFVFTWVDPTGLMHYGCLKVTSQTYLGSTTLSDTCAYTTSGTLVYNIVPLNDTTYIGQPYLKYDDITPLNPVTYTTPSNRNLFNVDAQSGLFATMMLVLVGILIGLPNAVYAIVYFSLALVGSFTLGLLNLTSTSTTSAIGIVSGIVLLGFIILYMGGKQN